MPDTKQYLRTQPLDELAGDMGESAPDSVAWGRRQAEIIRRQTVMQQQVTDAAVQTAEATRRTARYAFYSVFALAVTSGLTLIVQLVAAILQP